MAEAGNKRSILIKTTDEIRILQEANSIVAETLSQLRALIEPGITTWDLDKHAEEYCTSKGAVPAFKGYRGFPGSLCVSLNEEVVHGIPSRKRKLRKGDLISIDFGVKFRGYYGDSAISIGVGEVSEEKQRLMEVTSQSLEKAIEQVVAGNRVSDISRAVEGYVTSNGFSVVKQFVGHGIGQSLHEAPEVPNFYQGEPSVRLQVGMVLAIEPMVNAGTHKVKVLKDGWTVVTGDGKPSAHFEHSVAVTENGPLVLSRCAY